MTKHTPLPWQIGAQPDHITTKRRTHLIAAVQPALPEWKANAALIVRAVNSHQALVDALELAGRTLAAMSANALREGLEGTTAWDRVAGAADIHGAHDTIRRAIAAAKGE